MTPDQAAGTLLLAFAALAAVWGAYDRWPVVTGWALALAATGAALAGVAWALGWPLALAFAALMAAWAVEGCRTGRHG